MIQQLSEQVSGLVERAEASVVRVEGRRRGASTGVVWSADGVIVTAHHALEWDEEIEVGLGDGTTLKAGLLGRDPTTDLAALQTSGSALTPAAWADLEGIKVGSLVVALSRPGRAIRARLGIVSVLTGAWRSPAGGRFEHYLETDIERHPGFSGGALVDGAGRFVALNTAGLLRAASLGVPAATLRRVIADLTSHGRVRRGYLGVGSYPVRLPAELASQLGQGSALLIVSVEPDSPAARAGLALGDVLVAVDGQPVRHAGDLLPLLEDAHIGSEASLRILRAGEPRDVAVVIGERETRRSA